MTQVLRFPASFVPTILGNDAPAELKHQDSEYRVNEPADHQKSIARVALQYCLTCAQARDALSDQ